MAAHMAAFTAKAHLSAPTKAQKDQRQVRGRCPGQDRYGLRQVQEDQRRPHRAVKSGASTEALDAKLAKIDAHIDSLGEVKSSLKDGNQAGPPWCWRAGRQRRRSKEAAEYRHAFLDWMRAPNDHERQQRPQPPRSNWKPRTAMAAETRATQTVTSTGLRWRLRAAEIIERQIARLSVDISPIRQIATVALWAALTTRSCLTSTALVLVGG